jgi:hypothetical protein
VDPAPPDDIYDFYAREFLALVKAARTKQRFFRS